MIGTLQTNASGGLNVWIHPIEGHTYTIGVDTSAGIRGGDNSAAEVVDVETCEQVAEWHGLYAPTLWGYSCSRLGAYYNMAWLAFETHPSPHGLTAHLAAERYQYPKLWIQERLNVIDGGIERRKGWRRAANDTQQLLNRARDSLREGCPIHSSRLISELMAIQIQDGELESAQHDDCVIAYSIALSVRDACYQRGLVDKKPLEALDLSDLYWREKKKGRQPLSEEHAYDGSY